MTMPCGRLTLAWGIPVPQADTVNATGVSYTPFCGNTVPLFDGTNWYYRPFTEPYIALATYHLAGKVYDCFAYWDTTLMRIGSGPAWTSNTVRSAGVIRRSGILTNSDSTTLRYGSDAGQTATVAANCATYVGSFFCHADGQVNQVLHPAAATGGSNNIVGLYNAYNRQRVIVKNQDSASMWTMASDVTRPANGSTGNRITYLDGLGDTQVKAVYSCSVAPNSTSPCAFTIGIGFDIDSNFSGGAGAGARLAQYASVGSGQFGGQLYGEYAPYPAQGLHYVQAMEQGTSVEMYTFGHDFMMLSLDTEV